MSELTEKLWAVLSERGCESSGLSYAEALDLLRARHREKISGLSIITNEAARRAAPSTKTRTRQSNADGAGSRAKVKS
jgi:hypothetical protein